MSFKINAQFNGFNNLDNKLNSASVIGTNEAMRQMEQFVPMRRGHLRDSETVSSNGKTIRYSTPYARAQFYGFTHGYRIHNYTTPGTSRRWDLRLKGDSQKMKAVEKAYIKGAGLNGLN